MADDPLPPEPLSPEIILANGIQEQVTIGKGQLSQLTTVSNLISTQNAQTSLLRYGGDPKKFQDWIRSLDKYVLLTGEGGDSPYKKYALQSSEGPVSDFLVRFYKLNSDCRWDVVLSELQARFGDIVDGQHGLQVLRTTKQKSGETVQVFAERMLIVAEQAWPTDSITEPLIQRQILDVFIDGLQDSQIARKVLREGPETVAAAVKIAVEEQNLARKFSLRNRGFPAKHAFVRSKFDKPRVTDERHEVPMEVDTFHGQCFKCKRRGHRAVDCKSKRVHEVKAGTAAKLVCYRCGIAGHGIATCRRRGNPETGRCWQCGAKDHIRANCSKKSTNSAQTQPAEAAATAASQENWDTSA